MTDGEIQHGNVPGNRALQSLEPSTFFDLTDPSVALIFEHCTFAWEPLHSVRKTVRELGSKLSRACEGTIMPGAFVDDADVFICEGAVVEPGAYIAGPCFIGPGAVVRHGAYIRGDVIVLRDGLVGHATEAKNAIFLPGAHAPHFAYVGDSILGSNVNLGAGTRLSNVGVLATKDEHGNRLPIRINVHGENISTELTKFGAVIGDSCSTGCNTVLNPGTLLGARSLTYPNITVGPGLFERDEVYKLRQHIDTAQRRG